MSKQCFSHHLDTYKKRYAYFHRAQVREDEKKKSLQQAVSFTFNLVGKGLEGQIIYHTIFMPLVSVHRPKGGVLVTVLWYLLYIHCMAEH